MLEYLIQKDQELLIFLNKLGSSQWDGFWLFMTNKYTSVPLYLLLIIFFAKHYNLKKTLLLVVLGVLLITFSDQLANLFKYGFKRFRPCHQEQISQFIRLVKGSCGGKYSYFSAHASTGMALAVYFGLALQTTVFYRLKYYLIIFAFFVGYSRIYIGVHYPLDVLTGFVVGSVLGYLMFFVFKYLVIKPQFKANSNV